MFWREASDVAVMWDPDDAEADDRLTAGRGHMKNNVYKPTVI